MFITQRHQMMRIQVLRTTYCFPLFSVLSYDSDHTYIHTYLLARPLGAFQSQMDKAQWIKTRPQHRELRALLFTISVWVL